MMNLDRNVYETQPNTRYGEYIPRQIMLKKNGKKKEAHAISPFLSLLFSHFQMIFFTNLKEKKRKKTLCIVEF